MKTRPFREYNPHPLDRSSESQQTLDRLRADYIRRNYEPMNHRRFDPIRWIAYGVGIGAIIAGIACF